VSSRIILEAKVWPGLEDKTVVYTAFATQASNYYNADTFSSFTEYITYHAGLSAISAKTL